MNNRDTSARPGIGALRSLRSQGMLGVLLLIVLLTLPAAHFTAGHGAAASVGLAEGLQYGNHVALPIVFAAGQPAAASPVFADGFESGNLGYWTSIGGLVAQNSQAHDGSFAAQGNTTNGNTYAKKLLPATCTNGYARIFFNIVSKSSQVNLLRLRTAADGSLAYLFVSSTGKLGLRNDAGAATVTSATSVGTGWHALEFHAVINGTSGQTEVWLDGVLVKELSNTANLGSTPIGKVQIGEVNTGTTYNVLFDNVVFDIQRIGPLDSGTTPTNTRTPTATATQTANDVQPSLPVRAAFYYPWFPESWTQLGIYPYTNYHPSAGYYDSANAATIKQHIAAMQYGGIAAGIASWWGQGTPTDQRVPALLGAAAGTPFRWAVYYEQEGSSNPTASALNADLVYLRDHYGSDPGYLRINGRFVVFVYADGTDACDMADRWKQANTVGAYVVLKVFGNYATCASQPEGWHQYAPAAAAEGLGAYSYTISPGFYKEGEAVRLARDITRWRQNIRDMVASGARFQLVTTFDEWGEGTSVESASEWASASGYGAYLDALHDNGAAGANPTATSTPTNTPVPPGGSTSTPTSTPTKTPVPPIATSVPTNTPISVPGTCTAASLTKGPTLILTGINTEMKVLWQWADTANPNPTFTVRWGTDTTYSQGSASATASDTANHLYAYTISGLTPGTKYFYQVATGSQCASSSFYAPPPGSATGVKFFAYGDTRTNGNVHNGLAGQIVSLFQADPAFQTLNLNVGDWVSGDSKSAWTGEWFNTNYASIRQQDASIADTGVRGNHEGGATYWKRYFPQPYQPGGLYRSFDYGPMHIAMLDQYVAYNAGSTQYNWLKNDLAASTKTWKLVVLHEPGWSSGGGHGNNTTVQKDLEPLFKQYGVSIVFGGHNHYYARATLDNIQHLTVGGGADPYTPGFGYPNIVVTDYGYSFREFTIAGNTLSADIIDNTGKSIDNFTLTR